MSDENKISEILDSVSEEGRRTLTEYESKQVLSNWDVSVTETIFAENKLEAVDAARELKYPVVMKISAPEITDKSSIDGVRVGLTSEIEVRQAFGDIMASARTNVEKENIQGVVVQQYVPEATEVVMEVTPDPSFGPTVMFGLSGLWIEVLEDKSFRLAPVSEEDAMEMIKEIDGSPILHGAQGATPADIDALADIIQKISELPVEYEQVSELYLDSVFAFENSASVIDAQIVLSEIEEEKEE